jgi:predicted RNA-binding protein with PUA-like domain
MKSEPSVYSIDDLARDGSTPWTGVRNFVARNHMRDMAVGDLVLFYHSNADPSGVAGVGKVVKAAYPDPTQFDPKDEYFEPKATREKPYWYLVDVGFGRRFRRFVPLDELKEAPELSGMLLTSGKASRLSVQPVDKAHFDAVVLRGSGR